MKPFTNVANHLVSAAEVLARGRLSRKRRLELADKLLAAASELRTIEQREGSPPHPLA